MKIALPRTGSVPVFQALVRDSPRGSFPVACVYSGDKYTVSSPKICMNSEVNHLGIRRSFSESEIIRSKSVMSGLGSLNLAGRIPEEEYVSDSDETGAGGIASLILTDKSINWTQEKDSDVFSGGFGKGKSSGGSGGGDTDGNDDRKEIGAYYLEMLKTDPMNSLLLRNYGKFLHEVEGDLVKAEEYYGRAILASPGDGEVLSLYGKLIWENSGDEERAKSYFDQAVNASPDDCMVLGSYAQFMWEAEDDEEEIVKEIEVPGPWLQLSNKIVSPTN